MKSRLFTEKQEHDVRAIDLEAMTVSELDDLRTLVNETLMKKIEVEEAQIQERLAALAAIKGGKAPIKPSSQTKVEGKYRDPSTNQSWTGRGQPPAWVVEYERQGRKREEFLIAS
jgi:DNA-binding protein H-NS